MSILGRIKKAGEALFGDEPPADPDAPCELCGDTGFVDCRCGGDLCVCDNYGEQRCPRGCEEPDEIDE